MAKSLYCLPVLALMMGSFANAGDPVICTGSIRDKASDRAVGTLSGGVFDVDRAVFDNPYSVSARRLKVAELDDYVVSVHRTATSALLKTPEIAIEVRIGNETDRVAAALGQQHAFLILDHGGKQLLFNCYESAYYKSHNDLLCGTDESARPTSPYRKTCESLCEQPKRNFSADSFCYPYAK